MAKPNQVSIDNINATFAMNKANNHLQPSSEVCDKIAAAVSKFTFPAQHGLESLHRFFMLGQQSICPNHNVYSGPSSLKKQKSLPPPKKEQTNLF